MVESNRRRVLEPSVQPREASGRCRVAGPKINVESSTTGASESNLPPLVALRAIRVVSPHRVPCVINQPYLETSGAGPGGGG